MADRPYIECENLVKIYKVDELELVALQGLDISLARGEILGVIGPSGSGKSTLMNILGGLDRPSAGRARVGDQDLLKTTGAALNTYRRTQVGFVWQQSARNLVPYLNALENILLPMTLAGVKEREKRAWATELLERVNMADRKHHLLSQLSGGEQQRIAIAVALANRPGLLLADEPTGEVDEETALMIYATFRELNEQLDITILIVSHDPGIAKHVDRVVAIRDGKLATETVRRASSVVESGDTLDGVEPEPEFEELVVLDSAGRLQLPKEYLQQLAINKRVQLELLDDGIMVRPAASDLSHTDPDSPDQESTESIDIDTPTAKSGRLQRLLMRLMRRSSSRIDTDLDQERELE
jgi:ABC-type lipoprotein export system ATPase subunit/bifunctional DNA-binding transcriptional regulator/antitoxin component of YhaV-PrlF toxin-antitoxin module